MKDLDILVEETVAVVQRIVRSGCDNEIIGLHEPDIKQESVKKYVIDCINSGWVSSSGYYIDKMEEAIKQITGARYVTLMVNGTHALRMAMYVKGVSPGDEVWMPTVSFIATANAAAHLGAVPYFLDINNENLGLSEKSLRKELEKYGEIKNGQSTINKKTGKRIAAVVPVHIFGNGCNIKKIKEVADEWNLPVIEDSAEALGSMVDGKHCGTHGEIGIISFNGNKIVTTGGGGALLTNDKKLADRIKYLATTAKQNHPWEYIHDEVGWNDRMPNINAALGMAQIDNLRKIIEKKQKLHNIYMKSFEDIELIDIVKHKEGSNYWLNAIRLDPSISEESVVNKMVRRFHDESILVRPLWKLMHLQKPYQMMPRAEIKKAINVSNSIINLPSSPSLCD